MSAAIRVDDSDSSIRYSGSWKSVTEYEGNYATPFQSTFHRGGSQASFTYTFSGQSVLVAGSMPSVGAVAASSITCSIDGANITLPSADSMTLCEINNLSEEPHTLDLAIEPSTSGYLFFDYIQYVPNPTATIAPSDHATIVLSPLDPQLQSAYDASWNIEGTGTSSSNLDPSTRAATRTTNSTFEFLFNGTSLSWFGFYNISHPFQAINTTAIYSIDDQPPHRFSIDTPHLSQPSQLCFHTGPLHPSQHKLVVQYEGNNDTVPLTLQSLVIEHGSISGKQLRHSSGHNTTSSALPSSSAQQQSSSTNVSAIVGGVIGGIAIVIFGVFGVVLLRIRANGKKQHITPSAEFVTLPGEPNPYTPPARPYVRTPSMHKPRPPPDRYMPPLSTAGSMRSYDPPSTLPTVLIPETRSPTRRHHNRQHRHHRHRTAEIPISDSNTNTRSAAATLEGYITLNSTYLNSRTHDSLSTPPPEIRTKDASDAVRRTSADILL